MDSHKRAFNEKRDFIRMKVNTPAEIVLTKQNVNYTGICHDLSGGGMLLTLDKKLELDTELVVSVKTDYGHKPAINARCTVIRIEPGPQKTYLHGFKYPKNQEFE
jgi:c-di-GMP-binding flagellar brake protein YcgR